MKRWVGIAMLGLTAAACHLPEPYQPTSHPQSVPPPGTTPTTPVPSTSAPAPMPAPPAPTPVPPREPVLSPATRALVGQAQTQVASKNFPVAAASIERALRIEPGNALLWIELGKVRMAEGNYPQAENLGRKAVALANGAPSAQSAAWRLIADSFRARGKNTEARDADARAQELSRT